MNRILIDILNWSEVWALFIPIAFLLRHRPQADFLKPVIIYIWTALLINLFSDMIAMLHLKFNFPHWLRTNNYLYNVHSIVRFICFSWFFRMIQPNAAPASKIVLPALAAIFLFINFVFFEDFFNYYSFSSRLLTVESGLLLLYCLQYYLSKLKEEHSAGKRQAEFWIVTGLNIYVVVNFFIFLFYTTLIRQGYIQFVIWIWYVHNISFILLCIFIAKAFHVSRRN